MAVRDLCVSWAACLALPIFNRRKAAKAEAEAAKAAKAKAKATTAALAESAGDPEAPEVPQTEDWQNAHAAAGAFASAAAPAPKTTTKTTTTTVELVRSPLGLGLTVDGQFKVTAIDKSGQAKRSGGFAVGDQLVSINGQPLSGGSNGGSFDEQLGAIAFGTKVRLAISRPAGGAKRSTGLFSSKKAPTPAATPAAAPEEVVLVDGRGGEDAPDGGWL